MAITSKYDDTKFGAHFLGDILDWVASNFEPDEIFSADQLKEWAIDNGYAEYEEEV